MNDMKSLVSAEEFCDLLIAKLGEDMRKYIHVHDFDGNLLVLTSFEHAPNAPVFSATDDLAYEHGYRHNCSVTKAGGVDFGTSVLRR